MRMPSPLWGEPFDRLRATSNVEWGGHAVAEGEGVPGEGSDKPRLFAPPHPALRATFSPWGRRLYKIGRAPVPGFLRVRSPIVRRELWCHGQRGRMRCPCLLDPNAKQHGQAS